jgi:predicted dehydrogenase
MASPKLIPVAIADPSKSALHKARALSDQVELFESPDQLINPKTLDALGVDTVAIMTPPDSHAQLACSVLLNKHHILCEKPMTTNLKEAYRMVDAALSAPKSLAIVGHQLRYNAARQWIHLKLNEGLIGVPRHVSITYHFPGLFQADWTWWSSLANGGGLLYEYGSHQIDLLNWWFGPVSGAQGIATTVVAERFDVERRLHQVDSDDLTLIQLDWREGLIADIQLSGVATTSRRETNIYGTEGSIHLDYDDTIIVRNRDTGSEHVLALHETQKSLIDDPKDTYTQPHQRLLEDMADHIHRGTTPSLACSFADGLRVIDTINKIRPYTDIS